MSLTTFDEDGSGLLPPALYCGGWFQRSGTRSVFALGKWDGSAWQRPWQYGTPRGAVNAICASEGASTSSLLVAGEFTRVGTIPASRLARWSCLPRCPGDISRDMQVDLQDLAILLANMGMIDNADVEDGDLDGDRDVDIEDLSILLSLYGSSCSD
jgi:hypothetical protein